MTYPNAAALVVDLSHGLLLDVSDTPHPARVYGIAGDRLALRDEPGTVYGYCWRGSITIHPDGGRPRTAFEGDFFAVSMPHGGRFSGGSGYAIHRLGFEGMTMVGGPVENRGRLRYIDGCSCTELIAPLRVGDPTLQFLHFPRGIRQTHHTHPTLRAGLIHAGKGRCWTEAGHQELRPGRMFILTPDAPHGFETDESTMDLTVCHPDSDVGPTDEENPMLSRTIVEGVSAKHIDAIRTKGEIRVE